MQQSSQNQIQIQEDYNKNPIYQNIPQPQPQPQPQLQPQMASYNPNQFMIQQNPQFIPIIPIQQYQSNKNAPIIFEHSPPKLFNDQIISNDDSCTQADEIIKQLLDNGKDFAAFLNEICQKNNLKFEYIYNTDAQLK